MTQYKDPTPQAGEPKQAKKGQNEWVINLFVFALLLAFTVWLVYCQPALAP